ncbi:MAG TPA: efflux RND transporter periplasmic adaptor subunit, partial [Kofleriaceae bacterium]|nr:efflux RND transporter periplasmic adaptor subunit [Kofleriaceae bacterium]
TQPPANGPPPAMPADITKLAPTTVVDSSEYMATLRSRTAAIIQPQVDGQIVSIAVKSGEVVQPGQALLQIDPKRQQTAVTQVRETRVAREAQLKLAQVNLDRVQSLVQSGALPKQELDNAESAVAGARAEVAALGAEIQTNQVQLGYYRVVAPERGVVGDIPVRVGDRVTPQTVLTTVTDNDILEANVSVPVARAKDVHIGTELELIDATSKIVAKGTITFVSPIVSRDTQSVLVKADITNEGALLRADQLVRVRVVWSTHPGLVVPALSVTRLGGQAFVYVAQQAGQGLVAKQRPVTLGDLVDNTYPVQTGLTAGESIVTSNVQKLRDGAPVAAKPRR